MSYCLEDFNFDLPEELIAQHPLEQRDQAGLLVAENSPEFTLKDQHVYNLPDFLKAGDLLIYNDTRVLPARLMAQRRADQERGLAKVELTLHKNRDASSWWAFAKPAKKCRKGDYLDFEQGLSAQVLERNEAEVLLRFSQKGDGLMTAINAQGTMPLPPYIKRKQASNEQSQQDKQSYQTIFADKLGAVAAPTAGLHFTPQLLLALKAKGVKTAQLTLHVGAGTFLPVKVDDLDQHVMHSEYAILPKETAALIKHTKANQGRVIAVGTTVLRSLEAFHGQENAGETDIFIRPGYKFNTVDMLMTNFHLPKSTSAF